ncbi:MAG: STAS domain-containing protein [Planctomycetes bacterium]|nr:STAS domain-containing protein [Planctomycetota bacterium]
MPEPFRIETRELAPGCGVVIPRGALETAQGIELAEAVGKLVEKGWNRLIVLDLQHVPYMDGEGGFIASLSHIQGAGGRLVIVNACEPIREVYDMLGLAEVIPLLSSWSEVEAMVPDAATGAMLRAPADDSSAQHRAASASIGAGDAEVRPRPVTPEGCWVVKFDRIPLYGLGDDLKAKLMPMIDEGSCRFLVLDCGDAQVLDEGLLGAILEVQEELKESGGALLWANPSAKAYKILDLLNMIPQIHLFDKVSEAQSFAAQWIKLGRRP